MFSEIFGEDDLPEFKQLVDPSIHESDLDIVPYASIQALAHSCLKTQTQEGLYGTGLESCINKQINECMYSMHQRLHLQVLEYSAYHHKQSAHSTFLESPRSVDRCQN